MSDNIEAVEATKAAAATPPFFAVTTEKLAVMSVATMGLYLMYWFYRNWRLIEARERSPMMAILRSLFAIFFVYTCFYRIRAYGQARNIADPPQAGLMASIYIVLALTVFLPTPWMYLSLLSPLSFLPLQAYANQINEADCPGHDRNGRYSSANQVWLAVMGLFWVLSGLVIWMGQGMVVASGPGF